MGAEEHGGPWSDGYDSLGADAEAGSTMDAGRTFHLKAVSSAGS